MIIGTAGLELILVVDVKICQDDIYGPVLAHDLDIVHPHDHGHPLHHLAEHHVVTVQEIPEFLETFQWVCIKASLSVSC